MFRAFGVLCVAVAIYLALGALAQIPAEGARLVLIERLHVAGACCVYAAGICFMALYSRLRTWRGWSVAAQDRVVAALIALAEAMHVEVIAEGMETDNQRQALGRMGCHTFQGYLIGRPMPAPEFCVASSNLATRRPRVATDGARMCHRSS